MEFALICGVTILGFICLIVSGILRQVAALQEEVDALEEALRNQSAFQKKIQDICERGGKIGSTR